MSGGEIDTDVRAGLRPVEELSVGGAALERLIDLIAGAGGLHVGQLGVDDCDALGHHRHQALHVVDPLRLRPPVPDPEQRRDGADHDEDDHHEP